MHNTGVCLFMERLSSAILVLDRKISKPSHTPEDLALLHTLTPHLQRAVAVQRKLGQVELERSATEAALDRLPIGVLILSAGGSVRSYNAAAKAILDQRDGLCLGSTGLQAAHLPQAGELRRFLASACAPASIAPAGGWLQIPRPSGRRPFVVLVAPLRLPDRTLGLDPPKAIAFITDPERTPEPPAEALARLYGLTTAESNVTTQLLAGASVTEVAERLAITVGTARWTLKNIFDKLGVRSHAELVRVLLSGAAALRSGEPLGAR